MAKLSKAGHPVSPVKIAGRAIATTFWGQAWCENLEAYSDFENRLPRGRTYVRNGSVVDLQIDKGKVTARVSGSSLYSIDIKIKPLDTARWKQIQRECAGKIDSIVELLQGRLSSAVMGVVSNPQNGLFPKPAEISMDCSCPDWADLCKHLAATLYGVGARLDEKPELLFLLRGVDPAELISETSAAQAIQQTADGQTKPAIAESELAQVFGIEIDTPAAQPAPAAPVPKSAKAKKTSSKPGKSPVKRARAAKNIKPVPSKSRNKKAARLTAGKPKRPLSKARQLRKK
jgi:uncharacterized Zn finger protein